MWSYHLPGPLKAPDSLAATGNAMRCDANHRRSSSGYTASGGFLQTAATARASLPAHASDDDGSACLRVGRPATAGHLWRPRASLARACSFPASSRRTLGPSCFSEQLPRPGNVVAARALLIQRACQRVDGVTTRSSAPRSDSRVPLLNRAFQQWNAGIRSTQARRREHARHGGPRAPGPERDERRPVPDVERERSNVGTRGTRPHYSFRVRTRCDGWHGRCLHLPS